MTKPATPEPEVPQVDPSKVAPAANMYENPAGDQFESRGTIFNDPNLQGYADRAGQMPEEAAGVARPADQQIMGAMEQQERAALDAAEAVEQDRQEDAQQQTPGSDTPSPEEKSAESEPGSDPQSPAAEPEQDPVEDLLESLHVNRTPESLQIKAIRSAVNSNGKDTSKDLEAMAAKLRLVEEHFDTTEDGQYRLRPERALAALEQANVMGVPDENLIRQEIVNEMREDLKGLTDMDDEDLAEHIQGKKGHIDKKVAKRMDELTQKLEADRTEARVQANSVVARHFEQFPEHKAVAQEVRQFFEPFPAEARAGLVNSGMVNIGELARLYYIASVFEKGIRDAYKLGQGQKLEQPGGGSAPSAGVRTASDRAAALTPEDAIKDDIMRAGVHGKEHFFD